MTVRRVLIVDDHPIVRQGLRAMIDAEADLKICGEAQSERGARIAVRELLPDVVIVDLSLEEGDGISLIRDLHAHHPGIALLVLSMHDEAIYAERLLAAGAAGYIMKQAAADQLITALRAVLRGDTYLEPRRAQQALGPSAQRQRRAPAALDARAAGDRHDRTGPELPRHRAGTVAVGEDNRIAPPVDQAQAAPRHQHMCSVECRHLGSSERMSARLAGDGAPGRQRPRRDARQFSGTGGHARTRQRLCAKERRRPPARG